MDDANLKFMEVSAVTEKEVANYYLALTNNDVEQALSLFFQDQTSSTSDQDQPLKASRVGSADTVSCNQLTILEWNIQGLLNDYLPERTVAVVKEINRLLPDVVMLQEVIPSTLAYLKSSCGDYTCFAPPGSDNFAGHYFAALLVRKSTFRIHSHQLTNFPSSSQGRNLIKVNGECHGRNVIVFTSHLESCKEASSTRINQFIQVCKAMKSQLAEATVIFGADTNLRDYEVTKAKRSSEIVSHNIDDIWVKLGSLKDVEYSWDLVKNDNQIKGGKARLRFERLYMRKESSSSKQHFKPTSMQFVGTERLSCGLFPSDHWGILVKME